MAVTIVYLITDQPSTCPICGARTDIILSFSQAKMNASIQECLDTHCKHVFIEAED